MFNSFNCVHARRLGNKIAHLVAGCKTEIRSKRVNMNNFPQCSREIAEIDCFQYSVCLALPSICFK